MPFRDSIVRPSTNDIYIAAAIIKDEKGNSLLVRKKGTQYFMQAGGKIEENEAIETALLRELKEELNIDVAKENVTYIGTFSAPAANENNSDVVAEVFAVTSPTKLYFSAAAEIEEVVWHNPKDRQSRAIAPLSQMLMNREIT